MSFSTKKTLYYQLKQTILKWIEDGEYQPGSLLPSENQLQSDFNSSQGKAIGFAQLEGRKFYKVNRLTLSCRWLFVFGR